MQCFAKIIITNKVIILFFTAYPQERIWQPDGREVPHENLHGKLTQSSQTQSAI